MSGSCEERVDPELSPESASIPPLPRDFSPDSLSSFDNRAGDDPQANDDDDVDELSYMSLNESAAVELSIDLLGENNRLMQSCRSQDQKQSMILDNLMKEHSKIEGKLSEALSDQAQLQLRISEERESKAMIIQELKTENGMYRRDCEEAKIEIEKLRHLLEDGLCALRDHQRIPDVIDGTPSVDQLYEALNQANLKETHLRKEFEASMEQSGRVVDKLTTDLINLQTDVEILNNYNDELEGRCNENDNTMQQLRTQMNQLKIDHGEIQVQLQDSENLRCLTEDELRKCELAKSACQAQVDQLRCIKVERKDLQSANKMLKKQIETVQEQFKQNQIELHETKITLANVGKEHDELKETVRFLRSESNAPIDYQDTMDSLRKQLDQGLLRESQLRDSNAQMTARMAAVKDVQKAFESLKSSADDSKKRAQTADARINDLEKVMDEHLEEIKRLNSENQKLQDELHACKVDVESVTMQYDEFRVNANAQYSETLREHAERESRLLGQLHKFKEYPGKAEIEFVSTESQTNDVEICNHLNKINIIKSHFEQTVRADSNIFRQFFDLIIQYFTHEESVEHFLDVAENNVLAYTEEVIRSCPGCVQSQAKLSEYKLAEEKCTELETAYSKLQNERCREVHDLNEKINRMENIAQNHKARIVCLQDENDCKAQTLRQDLLSKEDELWNVRNQLNDKCAELETLTEQFVAHVQNSEVLHAESLSTVQKLSEALDEEKLCSARLRNETVELHQSKESFRRKLNDERNANELHMKSVDMVANDVTCENNRLRREIDRLVQKIKTLESKKILLVTQKRIVSHELCLVRDRERIALHMLNVPKAPRSPLVRFRSAVWAIIAAMRFIRSLNHHQNQLFPSKMSSVQ